MQEALTLQLCAEGKVSGTKRKGGRQGRASAEKAAKRRRMVGGILKTVGTAAPGQQCTQCSTQVACHARATSVAHTRKTCVCCSGSRARSGMVTCAEP